jgi:hypothetical protein
LTLADASVNRLFLIIDLISIDSTIRWREFRGAGHEGYVDRANLPPNICIERFANLTEAPHCMQMQIASQALLLLKACERSFPRTKIARAAVCAIAAFKSLSPSYGGELKLKD